jgi:hypothetical protein
MNIYYLVLAQVLRFGLRAAAAYLALADVTGDMQNELVEAIISKAVPIVLLAISEGWSFLQKKYLPTLLETARAAQPDASLELVKIRASLKSKAPFIY